MVQLKETLILGILVAKLNLVENWLYFYLCDQPRTRFYLCFSRYMYTEQENERRIFRNFTAFRQASVYGKVFDTRVQGIPGEL
jgi:hypothetical protein